MPITRNNIVKVKLGTLEFEMNPENYDPGYTKVSSFERMADGTLQVQSRVDENGNILVKYNPKLSGIDDGLFNEILELFRKNEFLYFRDPFGVEFDDSPGHRNKVYFVGYSISHTGDLPVNPSYTIELMEK